MNASLDLVVRRPLRPITNEQLASISSWARAMSNTAKASGLLDKSLAIECDIDASQLSKITSGQLGIMADKLFRFMDACGSELPLMWLLYQRGYDVEDLRQRETELQARVRRLEEQLAQERRKNEVIVEFHRQTRSS